MTAPIQSRQRIQDRIRSATSSVAKAPSDLARAYSALPRTYVRKGQLSPDACVKLISERLREFGAEVVMSTPETLQSTIAAQLQASGRRIFVAPPGLPSQWLTPGFDWKVDHGLTAPEVEQAGGTLTAAFCGIAESGTIVLHHSATEGRRVITLLPDWHLCILLASQVVQTLPEYFDRCQHPPALATFVSGPSATADIEMTRIKGVHGPRFLNVIIVQDETPA
jgi:L-lactate dehydrogenase complex protein LldG